MLLANNLSLAEVAFLAGDKGITGLNHPNEENRNLPNFIVDYQPYIDRVMRDDDLRYLTLAGGFDENLRVNDVLSRLAFRFLEWQGNHFEVKANKLEQWLELLSLVDGSWIIAQAYVELFNINDVSCADIIAAIEHNQCPHALSNLNSNKEFADNHVHLGGHGHTGPSLISFALYGAEIKGSLWPKRPEYTLFESGLLDKQLLPKAVYLLGGSLVNSAFNLGKEGVSSICKTSKLIEKIFHYQDPARKQEANIAINVSEKNDTFLFKTQNSKTPSQHAFLTAHCKPVRSDIKWLLFCLGTLWLEQTNENKTAIDQFVRVSNILRNYMVVWGVGLSQFVTFFGFSARNSRDSVNQASHRNDNLQTDMNSSVCREFRIAPGMLLNSNDNLTGARVSKLLHKAYKHSINENIHFVIHFSRSLKLKDKKEDKYLSEYRESLKKQILSFQKLNNSVHFADIQIPNDVEITDKCIDLRKAVRGYDVAGNENDLPIEMFAPALRVIRSSKHPSASLFGKRFQKPFLTVHAGEDYSHLLSGLRSIDEAVIFCEFKQGDRLGHALALGVNPEQWAKRQNTAYVSLGDHLDNLVWCYQKALKVSLKAPSLAGVIPLLQDKINFWRSHLYEDIQVSNVSTRDMFEAWKLRRNCPSTYNFSSQKDGVPNVDTLDPAMTDWIIDFDRNNGTRPSRAAYSLWQRYLNVENRNDSYISKRRIPVSISCCPKLDDEPFSIEQGRLYDSVSKLELDLYEAIQDMQMEQYAAKGIIIEACPTSNIYIGRFKHYFEHPIYRWDPPEQEWLREGGTYNRFGIRKGSIVVCVNTDDAAIMPTTIQNEHRVLQKAAQEHYKVGVIKAEEWIERIRKRGIEIFKSNHLNWIN
ncbi:antiviral RADAR system adenosine deaminase RdrB [Pseudoalteromonas piratica]|uniref:antiviral RADAR system adenosine deaminase RdrB n=1 Tax=Pseudoalteromonas piratica TaxID=1348114 RepID=UPI000691F7F9|nr:antiviral RADAR system adenosine deaminase RdrB [Pseudoalteromonas piratica]